MCDVVTGQAWCRPGEERQKSGGLVPGIGSIRHTSHSHQAAPQLGAAGAIELATKLREDFTIFYGFLLVGSAYTFKTLLRRLNTVKLIHQRKIQNQQEV